MVLALLLGLPEVSINSKEEKQVILSYLKVFGLDRCATCFKTCRANPFEFHTYWRMGVIKCAKNVCAKSTQRSAQSLQKIV